MSVATIPAPWDTAKVWAGANRGRRVISWNQLTPGELYRCRYTHAHAEVIEEEPYRGEPLRCSVRRRSGGYAFDAFTSRARELIRGELLRAVARIGFDRLWWEYHDVTEAIGRAERDAAAHRQLADWWDRCAQTAELLHAGVCQVRPRRERVTMWRPTRSNNSLRPQFERCTVLAELVADGELVGWLDSDGGVVVDGGAP